MATVIRFARHGTKKKPYFRMVVQNKTAARDGRFIEHIGAFDPVKGETSLVVKRDRLEYWLSTGAIMSDTVEQSVRAFRQQAPVEGKAPVATAPKASKPKAKSKSKEKEA